MLLVCGKVTACVGYTPLEKILIPQLRHLLQLQWTLLTCLKELRWKWVESFIEECHDLYSLSFQFLEAVQLKNPGFVPAMPISCQLPLPSDLNRKCLTWSTHKNATARISRLIDFFVLRNSMWMQDTAVNSN